MEEGIEIVNEKTVHELCHDKVVFILNVKLH